MINIERAIARISLFSISLLKGSDYWFSVDKTLHLVILCRVVAAFGKRMAAKNPPYSFKHAAYKSVFLYSIYGIF